MAITTERSIGERVREYRRELDMTQPELAAAANISVDLVRKLEQGQRNSVAMRTLQALAGALDISPSDLLGRETALPHADDNSGVRAIARRLTAVDDLAHTDLEVGEVGLDALRRTSTYAWGVYWAGRYAELGALLPACLGDAAAVVHSSPAGERAQALELSSQIHHLTGYALVQLGQPDTAYIAMRTAIAHAEQGEDPLRVAVSRGAMAWLLLTDGRFEEARRVATYAALEHDPHGREVDPSQVSVWGGLLLTAATAAARSGDATDAAELLAEASEAADRNGGVDRADYDWPFGPAQVVMQGCDVASQSDDPAGVLSWARRMPQAINLPLAARARHMTDVARAHQQLGHDEKALGTLLNIESFASEWLHWQPMPKAVTLELLEQERRRRSNSDLYLFADRLGWLGH